MIRKVKSAIQDKIYQKCLSEYKETVAFAADPYCMWIRETEYKNQEEGDEEIYPSLSVVYMDQVMENFDLNTEDKDIVIFAERKGRIGLQTFKEITNLFFSNPDIDVIYGDEDLWNLNPVYCDENGIETFLNPDDELAHRKSPWQKPVWSPDTLLSFNYFGNLFAVRRKALLDIEWLKSDDYKKNIYDFLLKVSERDNKPYHVNRILYHLYCADETNEIDKPFDKDWLVTATSKYDDVRKAALERRGIKAKFVGNEYSYPVYDVSSQPLVSIIIPSKDNIEVLKQCIRSIYNLTVYNKFEIIVVDNGSSSHMQMSLEAFRAECPFTYIYEPMEFNFSKMCNMGVEASKGDYILLLNDDMEVIDEAWLHRMLGQAMLPHVGGVGAKLLYPGTKLIQHVGVTNTCSGPGHKLKKLDDTFGYYYGRNKLIYDMIGVTAACLLISKEKYLEVGGLSEDLRVAYNDVDLCFKLVEKGYYNVQRNDVVLYHHESLSRGDDLIDDVKLKRLHGEMETLYDRHPKLYKNDPYNGILVNSGESEYLLRTFENHEFIAMTGYHDTVMRGKKLPNPKHMNHAIMNTVEEACEEKFLTVGDKHYYKIKGWAYVPLADNVKYKFKVLLKNSAGDIYEIPVHKKYRKDVSDIIDNADNVLMSGFCCWIIDDEIPAGTYDIWLYAKDSCSRQCMYRDTLKQIEIK